MERKLAKSSSLARKFFEDFPDAPFMPLQLTEGQQAAYQHVLPLLALDPASSTLPQCMQALQQLIQLFSNAGGAEQYANLRSLADYLQSVPALCLIDAAGALTLSSACMPAFLGSLRSCSPELYAALLHEELRRRLVANNLRSMASPVHTRFSAYPPVAGAILCAGNPSAVPSCSPGVGVVHASSAPSNTAGTFTCAGMHCTGKGSQLRVHPCCLASSPHPQMLQTS
jgi:hypothetical protein